MVPAEGTEISVRFKLPVAGAAYNFGAKFGATGGAGGRAAEDRGGGGLHPVDHLPSGHAMHRSDGLGDLYPRGGDHRAQGRCEDRAAERRRRLPEPPRCRASCRRSEDDLCQLIDRVATEAFGADRPLLVCEPGRALCGDAFTLAARVKALRDGTHVFLNDGVYGSLIELAEIGIIDRIEVLTPEGDTPHRASPCRASSLARPAIRSTGCRATCRFPSDIAEGDFVILQGMGAYSTVTNSRFNGFGDLQMATVLSLKL